MPSEPGYHTYFHFPPEKKKKTEKTCNARTQPLYMHEISFIRNGTAQSEKEFSFLSIDFFVSDMRGKCSRKADFRQYFPCCTKGKGGRPLENFPSSCTQLTRTNCPVLLNPVPFFIKIKKKFIRTHGGALELRAFS